MASDVIFDHPKMFEDFDTNGDIFLTDGVMDPKELYLNDLTCTKDPSSSSDSGISNLDELPDIANYTDLLHSFIDGDFKDIDFTLDDTVCIAGGINDPFDPDVLVKLESVKSEPLSPLTPVLSESGSDQLCFTHPVSPDFYTVYDDISTSNDSLSLTLPVQCGSPQQLYAHGQLQPLYHSHHQIHVHAQQDSVPTSPTTYYSLSSPSSPSSLSLSSPPVTCIIQQQPVSAQPTQHQQSHTPQQHQRRLSSPAFKQLATHNYTVAASKASLTPSTNILVLPQVKQEVSSPPPTSVAPLLSPHPQAISIIPITKPAAAVNLNAILSSKVKIQPKPGLENVSAGVVTANNTNQWFTTAVSQVPLPSHSISVGTIISSPLVSPSSISSCQDAKTMKRAQRIIKNRESASLSRKRKKEYLSCLEERLQAWRDENNRLLHENQALRHQVDSLQEENLKLKIPLSPAKKVCLMCFALLFAFNVSPISFMMSDSRDFGQSVPQHRTGRQLLSVSSADGKQDPGDVKRRPWLGDKGWLQFDPELRLLVDKLNISSKLGNMCPMYFNSTESLRLAEQLTGWMIHQEEEKKKKVEKKRQKRKKAYPTVRRFGTSAQFRSGTAVGDFHNGAGSIYPLQIFSGPDPRQQLLNAIQRRNDTFYVLSFSTDYFLVPATAHNITMRPRMSLLMPVVNPAINESTGKPEDKVSMMQIDCEILNTNLIHVQRSAFPSGATLNSTSHSNNQFHGSMHRRDEQKANSSASYKGEEQHHSNYWENIKLKGK